MATVKEVTTLDIQLQDSNREGTTTIKLDNPVANITREQISAVFTNAFSNEWFVSSKNNNPLIYLGEVTKTQSIKTTLDGEDFYVTPTNATLNNEPGSADNKTTATFTVSGATIQGYNIIYENAGHFLLTCNISENGLSIDVTVSNINIPSSSIQSNATVNLIIAGTVVPVTIYVMR